MVFKVIIGIISVFVCFSIVDAVTVSLNPSPIEVVISGWDYVWSDGKEIRIYISKGTTSINFGVVPPIFKGR